MTATKAMQMLDRWLDDMGPIASVEGLAKEIDPICRVEGYLYSDRKRIIFSDGSFAVYSSGRLTIGRGQ